MLEFIKRNIQFHRKIQDERQYNKTQEPNNTKGPSALTETESSQLPVF